MKIRGQPSEISSATTSYALPSIEYIFPNGTAPALGERKALVPTAGGVRITLYARNIGVNAPGTKLSVKYRGEILETPVTASLVYLPLTSSIMQAPTTPDRMAVSTTQFTSTADGIRYVLADCVGVYV